MPLLRRYLNIMLNVPLIVNSVSLCKIVDVMLKRDFRSFLENAKMGSNFKKAIFNEHVHAGILGWRKKAKRRKKFREAVDGSTSTTVGTSTENSTTFGTSAECSITVRSSTEGSTTAGTSTEGSTTVGTSTEGSTTVGTSTEGSTTVGTSTEGSVTKIQMAILVQREHDRNEIQPCNT